MYAKYYFALRAATEKKDFRRFGILHFLQDISVDMSYSRNYNVMMIQAPGADKIAERSKDIVVNENSNNTMLSMSV